jgi:hypothetical protein
MIELPIIIKMIKKIARIKKKIILIIQILHLCNNNQ